MEDENKPSIKEFFSGKNILVTGGTGFMGKVLIEKLLRSCGDIGKIYVLIRIKKGINPQERLKTLAELPLYDVLREQQPEFYKKIIPIIGDVVELGLGISDEDRKTLSDNVHIVYHAAASVRFDDALKDAVIMNTRGTREVVKLSAQMKKLILFVHVSTTYCNTDKKTVEEKLYPPHADWRETIKLAENVDPFILDVLSNKYTDVLPNTYTFTKSLAEHVVNDLCSEEKIPAIIFRPSIVVSTAADPFPGWIDNFNGPVGLLVAIGKGVLRSTYTDPDIVADYMPVDLVIKAMIIATWLRGILPESEQKDHELQIFNACNGNVKPVKMGEIVDFGNPLCWDIPLNNILWYPEGLVTKCWYNHYFKVIFYHLLPAIFIDGLFKLSGNKPILIRIHRKIYTANMALQYFITQEWNFLNDNVMYLEHTLLPCDQKDFSYNKDGITPYDFFKKALLGCRQYLLKEDDSTLEQARIHSRRMYYISRAFNTIWYMALIYIFIKINPVRLIFDCYEKMYIYFNSE